MSTKHLTATIAAALALSVLTAGVAQARPAPGTVIDNGTGKVSTVTIHKVHKVRSGYTPLPQVLTPAPTIVAKSGDGTSFTLVAELAGTFLIGAILIGFWASARSGRRIRPLPH
jgi:hypothetical protein